MKHFFPHLIALLLSAQASAIAEPAADGSVIYKTVNGIELKMDVFEPAGFKAADRRPAVVFFFGGGWTGGSTRQFHQQARATGS